MRAHTKFQETETNSATQSTFISGVYSSLSGVRLLRYLEKLVKMATRKMLMLLALTMLIASSSAGPLAYGICQTGCNAVWVTCVAAAGGVAGVSTGGAGVPAAIAACSAAQGVCMAACVAAGLSPTV
ncbi:uncharacterized protein LOC116601957 [Nematostella vectensis]|uniref:uncharacterized protein LOC116601957 n=1 Tax=Nematostella vectensis TaxID=45351 RepID=UPI002077848C|nr:uncharacterized protein LOC116601957 [Nematostella vectensis]